MCESLETTTKAVDVLEKMDHFFQQNSVSWNHVGSLCTDDAPFMLGAKSNFTTLMKKRTPHIISNHCALHRLAPESKTVPDYFKAVLKHVIECVNFIRARTLNHRLFQVVCDQMGLEHTVLLFHTDQRWSRGHKARSQGQPFRGQTLSRPRTGMLEAKDQGHSRKCSPKKKVFKKVFRAISDL